MSEMTMVHSPRGNRTVLHIIHGVGHHLNGFRCFHGDDIRCTSVDERVQGALVVRVDDINDFAKQTSS